MWMTLGNSQTQFLIYAPGWRSSTTLGTLGPRLLRTRAVEAVTAALPGNGADTQGEHPVVSAWRVSPTETRGSPQTERPHNRSHSGPQCEPRWKQARRISAALARRRLGQAWLRLPPRTLSKSWSARAGRTRVKSPRGGCRSWTPRRVSVPEQNSLPEPSVNLEIPDNRQDNRQRRRQQYAACL